MRLVRPPGGAHDRDDVYKMAMVDVDDSSLPADMTWSGGWRPLVTVPHSSNEPGVNPYNGLAMTYSPFVLIISFFAH